METHTDGVVFNSIEVLVLQEMLNDQGTPEAGSALSALRWAVADAVGGLSMGGGESKNQLTSLHISDPAQLEIATGLVPPPVAVANTP